MTTEQMIKKYKSLISQEKTLQTEYQRAFYGLRMRYTDENRQAISDRLHNITQDADIFEQQLIERGINVLKLKGD